MYNYATNLTCPFSFRSSADEKFRWNNQGRVDISPFINTFKKKHISVSTPPPPPDILYTLSSGKLCVTAHFRLNECRVPDEKVVSMLLGAE